MTWHGICRYDMTYYDSFGPTMAGGGFATPQQGITSRPATSSHLDERWKILLGCFFFIWSNALFQFSKFSTHTENTPKKISSDSYYLYISWIYLWRSFEIRLTKFSQPSSWDSHLILGLLVMMAPSKPFLTCHGALWNVLGITNGSGKFIPNTELMYGLFAYIWVVLGGKCR